MKTPFNFDTKVLIMMYLEDLPGVHVETRNYERPYIHVKPRYNEGPRDWQGSRFFLKYLAIIGVRKSFVILRTSLQRFVLLRFH